MALILWWSGFFLFSGSAISLRFLCKVLNREQPLARILPLLSCLENVRWLAYRPRRTSVVCGRVCGGGLYIISGSIPIGADPMVEWFSLFSLSSDASCRSDRPTLAISILSRRIMSG